jgi:Fic family protein/predicted esterase
MTRVLFLHGLEGSPDGKKGRWLRKHHDTVAPTLDTSSIEAALEDALAALSTEPDVVVGSSFGGAVLLEMLHIGAWTGPCVFLAGAGPKLTGRRSLPPGGRTVLIHGLRDDVVPPKDSRDLSASRDDDVRLVEVDDDHRLGGILRSGVLRRAIAWAVTPACFRPRFAITPLLQRQLMTIDRTRGFLEAVRLRPAWAEEMRNRVRVGDALASLRIEGNSLTLAEAMELAKGPPPRDVRDSEREFLNYLEAFSAIDDLRGDRDYVVRARDVREIHGLLVKGVRGGDRYAGQFRREAVQVGDRVGGEVLIHHSPPDQADVPILVQELLDWVARCKKKIRPQDRGPTVDDPYVHPVLLAGIAQHRLVWIHPFVDGNGRTARMLTAMLLYIRGYDFKHLFDLSSWYDGNRDAYYAALRVADETGDYTRWLEYFCGGFSNQMYRARRSAVAAADGVDPEFADGDE